MVFRRQYGTRRPVRRTANGMSQLGGGRRMRRRGGFRWQIMLLFALGAGGYYLINQKTSQVLADNQPVVKDIRRIGERLARTADQMLIEETGEPSGFDWAVNVIDSDQANAFALPGGYSAVYTGLIPIAENENGIAVIMGHEIAHALAHHGAERMAQQNMQRIVGAGVSLGAGGMDYGAQQAVMGVFGGISQYGFALPFSRKHETEADEIGLWIVARACYDPREAPLLWERMGASAGANPPEFQSTHPSPQTRVEDFRRWMPKAIEIYNQNCPTDISLSND